MMNYTASAPAKIIITGEHSVIYGSPCISMAVNRFAHTKIFPSVTKRIGLTLTDFKERAFATLKTLKKIQERLLESYHLAIKGDLSIREVLQKPAELFQFACISFLEACNLELKKGFNIDISSNIPIGCGMGSSAATIVSTISLLAHFLKIEIKPDWLHKLTIEVERLQHGFSSGIDSFVSLHGGTVKAEKGHLEKLDLGPRSLYLVNTGSPLSTTGECVMHVKKHASTTLFSEFTTVANSIERALFDGNDAVLKESIAKNHTLLSKLGVVPEKIKAFISSLEKENIAAKICGAGSIKGDAAGVIMLLADSLPEKIVENYGYKLFEVQTETSGVRFGT